MSIHRFEYRAFEESLINDHTASGGTISNYFPNRLDINLNNDADLTDLIDLAKTLGLEYTGLVDPTFPPNDWRQILRFSEASLSMPLSTDIFFGMSSGNLTAAPGITEDLLPTRFGRVTGLVVRSSLAVTLQGFVTVNAGRTNITASTVCGAGTITPFTITTFPEFNAGDNVGVGFQNTGGGGVTADVTVGLEIQWG